jgi:H+/Cl- antiporter ClcA
MGEKRNRAVSAEFVCTLIGIGVGLLVIPPVQNFRPTFGLEDFRDLLWVIGGGFTGALVGMIITRVNSRFRP